MASQSIEPPSAISAASLSRESSVLVHPGWRICTSPAGVATLESSIALIRFLTARATSIRAASALDFPNASATSS